MNEIISKHQKTHGDLKNKLLPMKVKEHSDLEDSPFLNEKYHKEFQHMSGLCQWMIFVGRFDLAYAISSFNRFLASPCIGHIDQSRLYMVT